MFDEDVAEQAHRREFTLLRQRLGVGVKLEKRVRVMVKCEVTSLFAAALWPFLCSAVASFISETLLSGRVKRVGGCGAVLCSYRIFIFSLVYLFFGIYRV